MLQVSADSTPSPCHPRLLIFFSNIVSGVQRNGLIVLYIAQCTLSVLLIFIFFTHTSTHPFPGNHQFSIFKSVVFFFSVVSFLLYVLITILFLRSILGTPKTENLQGASKYSTSLQFSIIYTLRKYMCLIQVMNSHWYLILIKAYSFYQVSVFVLNSSIGIEKGIMSCMYHYRYKIFSLP